MIASHQDYICNKCDVGLSFPFFFSFKWRLPPKPCLVPAVTTAATRLEHFHPILHITVLACAVLCCAGCTVDDVHITIGHRPCLVMDGCQLNLNLLLLLPFAHVYYPKTESSSSSSSSFSRKTKNPFDILMKGHSQS